MCSALCTLLPKYRARKEEFPQHTIHINTMCTTQLDTHQHNTELCASISVTTETLTEPGRKSVQGQKIACTFPSFEPNLLAIVNLWTFESFVNVHHEKLTAALHVGLNPSLSCLSLVEKYESGLWLVENFCAALHSAAHTQRVNVHHEKLTLQHLFKNPV